MHGEAGDVDGAAAVESQEGGATVEASAFAGASADGGRGEFAAGRVGAVGGDVETAQGDGGVEQEVGFFGRDGDLVWEGGLAATAQDCVGDAAAGAGEVVAVEVGAVGVDFVPRRFLADVGGAVADGKGDGAIARIVDDDAFVDGAGVAVVYASGDVVGEDFEASAEGVVEVSVWVAFAAFGEGGEENAIAFDDFGAVAVEYWCAVETAGERSHFLGQSDNAVCLSDFFCLGGLF